MELALINPQLGIDNFKYKEGTPKIFKQENGVTREFCDQCGEYICEYGVRLLQAFMFTRWLTKETGGGG